MLFYLIMHVDLNRHVSKVFDEGDKASYKKIYHYELRSKLNSLVGNAVCCDEFKSTSRNHHWIITSDYT